MSNEQRGPHMVGFWEMAMVFSEFVCLFVICFHFLRPISHSRDTKCQDWVGTLSTCYNKLLMTFEFKEELEPRIVAID